MASTSDVLVTTQWVTDHLNDPNVKLVEVDVDTTAYYGGHIPGAIGWNWTTELQDQVRRDIIGKAELERLLSRSGIGADDTIVLYGDNSNWFAAYAFWLLEMYGHRHLRLMDGGRQRWLEEARPLTEDVPHPAPTEYRAREPDTSLRARQGFVLESLGRNGRYLVDVRSAPEFSGEVIAPPGITETAQRGGHIPGAVNVHWAGVLRDDGTFKPPSELRRLYESYEIRPDGEVITYCRIGERSSHTWFVLKHLLGYQRVRNYDGSWTEWGSMVDVPIER